MKILLYITAILCVNFAHSARVLDRIYEDVEGDKSCFKRFNGTHEIGCTSSFWGNVGVVHLVMNVTDLDWVIDHGKHAPYVLAVTSQLFNPTTLRKAEDSKKVSGVVLLQSESLEIPTAFSGERSCPNRESSFYLDTDKDWCPAHPWNPPGTSVLYENYNFPIFLIKNDSNVRSIISCYNKFNVASGDNDIDWPLCAIELTSNMKGTTNSEICMRRSQKTVFAPPDIHFSSAFCEPLEDVNIWATMLPLNKTTELLEKSIILVSTAADASSMFDNISPGANSAVSGLVTLLLTAEALKRNFDNGETSNKNIMFSIYEGEAWDYIGSSKMVYDMTLNDFPVDKSDTDDSEIHQVNLTHLHSIIDIRQVAQLMGSPKNLFLHTDPISNEVPEINTETTKLINILMKQNSKLAILEAHPENPIPPSSFQSFLKAVNISGVVITDHKNEFHNKYYQSVFDDYNNINFKSSSNDSFENDQVHKDLADIASAVASSLYFLMTNTEKTIEADEELSAQLLYCYLKNTNCSLFVTHSDEYIINYLPVQPAKMYVSVRLGERHLSYITGRLLSHFIGDEVPLDQEACTSNLTDLFKLEYFPYMNNGTCIKSTKHGHTAISPAFVIDDYDWQSGLYSTWTESTWAATSARIFLRPSPMDEGGLVITGVMSLLISLTLVHFMHSRADILFPVEISPVLC